MKPWYSANQVKSFHVIGLAVEYIKLIGNEINTSVDVDNVARTIGFYNINPELSTLTRATPVDEAPEW